MNHISDESEDETSFYDSHSVLDQQPDATHNPSPAIAREDSTTLGDLISSLPPIIQEPPPPPPTAAAAAPQRAVDDASTSLQARPSVRKARSFQALGVHQQNRASKSTPELHHFHQPAKNDDDGDSPPPLPLPTKRPRKTSALGLGLSWAGFRSFPSSSDHKDAARASAAAPSPPADRPTLSTRKSFSFLRPHSRSVTAPPPQRLSPTHTSSAHLSPLEPPSPAPSFTNSPESATPSPAPSLPSLDFQTGIDWDLLRSAQGGANTSSRSSPPPIEPLPPPKRAASPLARARSKSPSLGKWSRGLKDAVAPSSSSAGPAAVQPLRPQLGRNRSGSTNSIQTSAERRASMRRSQSHQGPPPPGESTFQLPQAAYMSMPSSPLAQPSQMDDGGGPTGPSSYNDAHRSNKSSTLTFALPDPPHDTQRHTTSTEMRRSASANSDHHLPHRPYHRRNSVASAIHALNPFNSHHSNASKQSLGSDLSSGGPQEHLANGLSDSPSDERDLGSLFGRSSSPASKEFGQMGASTSGDNRKRSASMASNSSGNSGFLNSVFGRRRGQSMALHHVPPPLPSSSSGLETRGVPSGSDPRQSTSSAASYRSGKSDATSSPVSSRKPSMVFSAKQTGTRSSFSSQHSPTLPPAMPLKDAKPPKAEEHDTPESYLLRLEENCAKTQIAKSLASSSDPFYVEALRLYISHFSFRDMPIDIALRKLLLELFLPKETQQIDRVMEAFAQHYHQENPGLFNTSDQCYILAFSLIMLHTDAFNAHNKNKMSKEDYTKNTRIDGLPVELLEYCYDNTVYCQFMFVDGNFDLGAHQPSHLTAALSSTLSSSKEKAKTEVYQLIQHDQTGRLRVGVHRSIPFKNPYSFTGTVPFFNSSELQDAFVRSHKLYLPCETTSAAEPLSPADATESSGVGGLQVATPPEFASVLHFAKAGVLLRKDDLDDGGKKASSRKWREWAVVLTKSQLLFFKDAQWASTLLSPSAVGPDGRCTTTLPAGRSFKPDAILPLQGFVAIYDFSFTKRPNTFILIAPDSGRQLLFQTADDGDMNEWIGLINWAASFQNTGVKLRTQSTINMSQRKPRSSDDSSERPSKESRRLIFSAQGQVVGSAPGEDPDWDDDHVFEQFTQGDLSHLTCGRASRTDIVRKCILELDKSIASDKSNLQRDLRHAKILHSLQPFSTSTRSRLAGPVPALARRIRQLRLSICKNSVSREVLARDLLAEERDITRVLMQGAGASSSSSPRPSLQSHRSEIDVSRSAFAASQGGTPMSRSRTEEV